MSKKNRRGKRKKLRLIQWINMLILTLMKIVLTRWRRKNLNSKVTRIHMDLFQDR
jgi:hypothetical protein